VKPDNGERQLTRSPRAFSASPSQQSLELPHVAGQTKVMLVKRSSQLCFASRLCDGPQTFLSRPVTVNHQALGRDLWPPLAIRQIQEIQERLERD
jgi:hypothetical protein